MGGSGSMSERVREGGMTGLQFIQDGRRNASEPFDTNLVKMAQKF